jgi:predicted secreted hydrolase
MQAAGSVTVDGRPLAVEGTAWFDHQWGDFVTVGGGNGWDWFAINLDDGTDVMMYLLRSPDGTYPLTYGTLVQPDGAMRSLDGDDFSVGVSDSWTSPHTGAAYPAGWTVTLPAELLEVTLIPTVADQELDTRSSSGVVYWEGSQVVTATRGGEPLDGEAYVELTGYASQLPGQR